MLKVHSKIFKKKANLEARIEETKKNGKRVSRVRKRYWDCKETQQASETNRQSLEKKEDLNKRVRENCPKMKKNSGFGFFSLNFFKNLLFCFFF